MWIQHKIKRALWSRIDNNSGIQSIWTPLKRGYDIKGPDIGDNNPQGGKAISVRRKITGIKIRQDPRQLECSSSKEEPRISMDMYLKSLPNNLTCINIPTKRSACILAIYLEVISRPQFADMTPMVFHDPPEPTIIDKNLPHPNTEAEMKYK